MFKSFLNQIPKKVKIIIAVIVVMFTIGFGAFILSPLSKMEIPPAFSQGREEASRYAQEIVSIANEISSNLKEIQKLEGADKEKRSLEIINSQIEKNDESRKKAILLTEQLSKMTSSIPYIRSEKAKKIALEALSSETILVQKLINRSDLLQQLLGVVKDGFLKKNVDYEKINKIIDNINKETEEINALNEKFLNLINDFDNYFAVIL